MRSSPPTPAPPSRIDRRVVLAVVVVLAVAAVAVAAFLVWLFFFANEAPAAPTLDDALRVIQPSAAP